MRWLYRGEVTHIRHTPRRNRFRYKVFYLVFPLDRLRDLRIPFFSVDRFNLFSFYAKDHSGHREGGLLAWGREQFRQAGLEAESLRMQTFPRFLGHVFNPVSFWYGYNRAGELVGVIAEVNNTFGGRHPYILHKRGEAITGGDCLRDNKQLHVSPFNDVEGEYEFFFRQEEGEVRQVSIRYLVEGRLKLYAHIRGIPGAFTPAALLREAVRIPFLGARVLFLIHYQALKIFLKGVPFVGSRPRKGGVS